MLHCYLVKSQNSQKKFMSPVVMTIVDFHWTGSSITSGTSLWSCLASPRLEFIDVWRLNLLVGSPFRVHSGSTQGLAWIKEQARNQRAELNVSIHAPVLLGISFPRLLSYATNPMTDSALTLNQSKHSSLECFFQVFNSSKEKSNEHGICQLRKQRQCHKTTKKNKSFRLNFVQYQCPSSS